MPKKIKALIRLQIPAGKANPAPPVGPALGQQGVNIVVFCKDFNAKTKEMEAGLVVTVIITVYQDRSFSFIVLEPPAAVLLKKCANLEKGSATPHTDKVAKITKAQLAEIATRKRPDLTASDLPAAMRTIAGTARSMGIEVEEVADA